MNIERMIIKLIKAQEAINEPIIITRKTEVEDEIHSSYSGDGSGLMALQVLAISDIFKTISEDITLSQAVALKKSVLKTIESNVDDTIEHMTTHKE